jgi:peptide/nickel transport system substrate-binding protein
VLGCVLAAGSGCGPARAARIGDTAVVIGVAHPTTSEPSERALSRVSAILSRAALLRLERSCRTSPALAESVTAAPDSLSWTVRLREGLRYHDGQRLDATSVAGVVRAATPAGEAFQVAPGLRDVTSVDVLDPRTFRISLRARSALLLEALAALEVNHGAGDAAGAGPFVPGTPTADQGVAMAAFDGFHLGRPAVDRVVLRSYSTPRRAWSALMRGEVDALYEVDPAFASFVAVSGNMQVRAFLRPFVYVMGFNLRHPALKDAASRRHLAAGVDREAIIRHAFDGRGVVATDPIWPLHWANQTPGVQQPAPVVSSRPGRFAPRLALTCLVPAGLPTFERIALSLQRSLFDVGVDLRIDAVPLREMAGRLARGQFDTYLLEHNAFGLSWTYWMWHSEASWPLVLSGYRGADDALDHVRRASDDGDMRAAVEQLRQRLREDPPAVFLCWTQAARAVSTGFALPGEPDRDIIGSVARWHRAPASH